MQGKMRRIRLRRLKGRSGPRRRALLFKAIGASVLAACAPAALGTPCHGSQAPVCTFRNDYPGFVQTLSLLGATPRTIDFETLPDGTPSHGGVYITPTFN